MKKTRQEVLADLKDELKTIKKLNKLNEPTENEDYREPLGIDFTIEARVQLSWGGPEDGYKIRFDQDGTIKSGVYYWADWGEYQEVEMTDEETELVCEFYQVICPSVHEF